MEAQVTPPMSSLFEVLKWGATLGPGSQNFLGARWIQWLLQSTPESRKELRALQILSLSPHYFLNRHEPGFAEMPFSEYLRAAFDLNKHSRERIVDEILSGHIRESDVVLDYGCGPGFLASALAKKVQKVFAHDISPGALACARILNHAENIEYIGPSEFADRVPDQGVDLVVSFALIQHLTDEIYEQVISNCMRKLKPGGRLVLHIQLMEDGWRTEQEWRDDHSLRGRVKLKIGLNCFARPDGEHRRIVGNAGFERVEIISLAEKVTEEFDDVCRQHLLTAVKPG